jgi:uncharacterized protein YbjT (DUF2867 family)
LRLNDTASATAVAEQPEIDGSGRGKPVLVTGASGLVGRATCAALSARGWKLRALIRDPAKAAARLAHLDVEFRVGDIRDASSLDRALEGAGTVIHLAAIAIERKGESYESTNTNATLKLVDAATRAGATRFVHMSQNGAASGSPYSFLRSKGLAEDTVTASTLEWTVLRPSVIFGPADEFVNVLARLALLSPLVFPLPDGGKACFQPIAVSDVASAVAAVLEKKASIRQSYALGGPEPLSLKEMAERILDAIEVRRVLVPVPVAILRPVVAVLQRVLPNPPVTSSLLDLLAVDNTVADNAIETELGVSPTRFDSTSLAYLRRITRREALTSLFRQH